MYNPILLFHLDPSTPFSPTIPFSSSHPITREPLSKNPATASPSKRYHAPHSLPPALQTCGTKVDSRRARTSLGLRPFPASDDGIARIVGLPPRGSCPALTRGNYSVWLPFLGYAGLGGSYMIQISTELPWCNLVLSSGARRNL